ncbi:MAG: OmpA family protein [Flavobacteriaceae bacterium]|nr:OmpA family protein [Flavobacteriaceae bacterium]
MKKIALLILLLSNIIFAQETHFSIQNLSINTQYSDFGTAYLEDSTVVYASAKKDHRSIINRIWKGNKQPYLELYKGTITKEGDIIGNDYFSDKINTKYHESNVTFSDDFKTVYFNRDNYNTGTRIKRAQEGKDKGWVLIQLYKATVEENGEWSDVTKLPFNNQNYQSGHPSLDSKENKLYFISDMPGGYGKTDIYVVDIHSDGTYGEPVNLGPEINTPNREMFPFISSDNTLFFSSDGQPFSHGKLDIYATRKGKNGNYITPVNLGFPINSSNDDFAIVYRKNKKTGHFSSNREGGKGDDDIYSFKELKPLFTEKECATVVRGIVRNKKIGALLPQATVSLFKDGKIIERIIVGNDASFSFEITCESNYKVVGSKLTYTSDTINFQSSQEESDASELVLTLEDTHEFIQNGKDLLIRIKPIYFGLNKSKINLSAAKELDIIVAVMKKYPALIIEGGSHTDSRGSDRYNELLSIRRAKSTVKYIIEKGIHWSRISAKGYGESQLVNKCTNGVKCSKSEHLKNRRTEFVIKNPEAITGPIQN